MTGGKTEQVQTSGFQSTLPRREWRYVVGSGCCCLTDFNPHSQEGSDFYAFLFLFICRYFNPHSQEGSDMFRISPLLSNRISIHTPKKGVTFPFCTFQLLSFISIHTPKKGVTIKSITKSNWSLRFQSTLPRREWQRCMSSHQILCPISIHTPKKGVTKRLSCFFYQ